MMVHSRPRALAHRQRKCRQFIFKSSPVAAGVALALALAVVCIASTPAGGCAAFTPPCPLAVSDTRRHPNTHVGSRRPLAVGLALSSSLPLSTLPIIISSSKSSKSSDSTTALHASFLPDLFSSGTPPRNREDLVYAAQSSKRNQQPPFTLILLSAALSWCLCDSAPQLASAEDAADSASPVTSIVSEGRKIGDTDTPTTTRPSSISNYLSKVFSSPDYGATPSPTDSRFDNVDARNRAYDQAFQQDARDRDAYYGKMAMLKRERALQDVSQNRRALGLDGDGDVRSRVGEEKVAGMASLREYLLQQDPSTLTPEELKVYNRMKEREQINEDI